jgi:hypothetical protein
MPLPACLLAVAWLVTALCAFAADTTAPSPAPAAPGGVPAEVFDVVAAIAAAPGDTYSTGDVQRLCRAIWWDITFDRDEQTLARQLNDRTRPVLLTCLDGRTLAFPKVIAPESASQQRFLLPPRFSPADSMYFVGAFRNLKDAGVYIGACRVHENAASVMETTLNDMINEVRYRARTAGDKVVLQLFAELETAWRDAHPGIQGEFADAVRRVLHRYSADPKALPAAVREAAWLQPPGG